jgi:hypothetical protein
MRRGNAVLAAVALSLLPGVAVAQVPVMDSDQAPPAKSSAPLDLTQPTVPPPPTASAPAPAPPTPPPAASKDAGPPASKAPSKEATKEPSKEAGAMTPTSGSGFLITEGIGFVLPGVIGLAYPPGTPDPGAGFRHTAGATALVVGGLSMVGGIVWAGAVPSQHVTVHGSQWLIMTGTMFLVTGTVMTINAGITAGVGVAGGCNANCPSAQDTLKTAGTVGAVGGGALIAIGLIWGATAGAFGSAEPSVSAAKLVVGPGGVSGTF